MYAKRTSSTANAQHPERRCSASCGNSLSVSLLCTGTGKRCQCRIVHAAAKTLWVAGIFLMRELVISSRVQIQKVTSIRLCKSLAVSNTHFIRCSVLDWNSKYDGCYHNAYLLLKKERMNSHILQPVMLRKPCIVSASKQLAGRK